MLLNDQILTLSGWELDVQVSMGLMLFVMSIPDEQRGRVEGLLGKSILQPASRATVPVKMASTMYFACFNKL